MTDQKCRIGYFCPSKSWGGLEMNQLRNAQWMKNRGHEVFLFVQEGSKIEAEAHEVNIPTISVLPHKKYYDVFRAQALKRKIESFGISHLVVRDPKDMSVCALAKTFSRSKFFLAYFMEMQIGMAKRDILHTIRYKQYDLWSCPLPWLQKQVHTLTKFPPERTVVIPSGLDLDRYYDAPPPSIAKKKLKLATDVEYIGLVGRFDPQKGQLLLLEAFNQIKNKIKHNLVLLGESTHGEADEYFHQLRDFVRSNDLEDRVFFRSFRKDVEVFYSAIDVFVMATESETFGMVTIEALASGCRIVGSNKGGTVEILNHGEFGKLFISKNVNDLSNQIINAIEDPDFNPQEVIEESKKYSAAKISASVEKVFGCN
ncbi:hypothetical protein CW751_12020 [Brumimicrobium salinarum]|uniref:Glycosyl transferase family 1 domain-containing protein n=1 Tax=Brumimicrobium salinarum TaxID=2058658 RepID=A0A2I0R106_9FLAO|nr:glycosyltransferase family 4 protein [Brumimicrobium salinarum]PKR80080.1 hypothetical protein CW751_12020 [Brumimicrobium salinarum]